MLHFTYSNFRLKDAVMKHYHHLTQELRYSISEEIKTGKTNSQIARSIGCCRQTIWRERNRNAGKRGYRPIQAHTNAGKRRSLASCDRARITEFGLAFIAHKLAGDHTALDAGEIRCEGKWSPAQIHGGLTTQGWQDVPSHEWIYQHIYQDKQQGGCLHQHLRAQKTYRKRGLSGHDRRGQIPNKVSIHQRPAVIDARSRIGDIEGDTIIGRHHKGAVLTLLERKSLYCWLMPMANRKAGITAAACVQALAAFKPHSITFDNGKEFTQHPTIAAGTGAEIYFADAYQSNQRARNENNNGLVRQFLPSDMPLDQLDPVYVRRIERALNTRPRKSLGWKTPEQVLSEFNRVALQT